MLRRVFLIVLIYLLFLLVPEVSKAAPCHGNSCGPGNECQIGFRCDGAGTCVQDTTCDVIQCNPLTYCNASGGCAFGFRCTSSGGGGQACQPDTTCLGECSTIGAACGADPSCSPNENCEAGALGVPDCVFDTACVAGNVTCTVGLCGAAAGCPTGEMCIGAGGGTTCYPTPNCAVCTTPSCQIIANFDANIAEAVSKIYNIFFPVVILLGVVFVIVAGYIFMTSQGAPEKVKLGSESLTSAITGIIFVVLSMVILRVIIKTFIDPTFM